MTQPTHGLDPNALEAALTRPIIGIENRTPQEAFDIMADRFRSFLASLPQQTAEPVAWRWRWGKLGRDQLWHLLPRKPGPFPEDGYEVEPLYTHPASPPVGGAVGLDAKLRSLATTLEAYGLDYMQARHVIEKVAALASSERSGREAVDLAEIERVARKVNPGRSEDHIKSVALDALSIIRALSQNPGTSNTSGEVVAISVKTMKLSDGREDHYVSIRVGDREITPHKYSIKGRAEFDVAEWNWLLNGAEKPDVVDWLDRTRPLAALEPRASDREAVAHGLELAAKWHDQRARDTPDAFETEFHQVSAAAIRKLSEVSHEH
jgi:hypothetical protein